MNRVVITPVLKTVQFTTFKTNENELNTVTIAAKHILCFCLSFLLSFCSIFYFFLCCLYTLILLNDRNFELLF